MIELEKKRASPFQTRSAVFSSNPSPAPPVLRELVPLCQMTSSSPAQQKPAQPPLTNIDICTFESNLFLTPSPPLPFIPFLFLGRSSFASSYLIPAKPRYDQSTFIGRLRHFMDVTDWRCALPYSDLLRSQVLMFLISFLSICASLRLTHH